MGTSAAGEGGAGGATIVPSDNTGTGATGGAGGAGATGGSEGTPGATAAATGATGTLDRSKLPPLLRGMNEDQIGETFNEMFAALRRPTEPVVPPKAPEPPKRLTTEDLKERFDTTSDKFDPRGAMQEIVAENYGGLITDISRKANDGMKAAVRGMIPDFQEHESDIDKALEGINPTQINQQVMVDTYLRVVGAKALRQKIADQKKPPTTQEPTPRSQEDAPRKLSDEEIGVAKVMFRGTADPIAAFHAAEKMIGEQGVTVKVPGNK